MTTPQKITLEQFNALSSSSFRHPMAAQMMEEREWYKSQVTTVAGFVGRDKTDNDYWAMTFGPDSDGKFGCLRTDSSIASEVLARESLFKLFEEHEATGHTVFCHCQVLDCNCGCPR